MKKTLRVLMPQWQGGNNPAYSMGAKLLAWLAPPSENAVLVEVPVEEYGGQELVEEKGVLGRSVLLKQLQVANKIIEAYQPDKVIMFGGDCLVSQAPMAYLNERYEGKLGVLWLDAHPDVSTPQMFYRAHAMVLGNLLGGGDSIFAAKVKVPLDPKFVMFGGLQETTPEEAKVIKQFGIRHAGPRELAESSEPVLAWLKENQIKYLAIHLDLDVLSPQLFRALLFANPEPIDIDAARGEMSFQQLTKLIGNISQATDVVGFSMTEHMPWDAINISEFMRQIDIFR